MKKIISVLLLISFLFSFVSCGEYNPPEDINNGEQDENKNEENKNETPSEGGTAQRGEAFVAKVTLDGKPFTPQKVNDDSLALKVRWTDGKSYSTVNLGEDGKAECYGLDGEYSVTLINLPDGYTYDPNIYVADNDNREVVIELLTLSVAKGAGTDVYKCIKLSTPGVYRAEMTYSGQEVFYEFEPTKAGIYRIESIVDISAGMYDPVLDIYQGHSQYKIREKRIEGGGVSGGYTTNFKHVVSLGEEFVGNCYTFAVMLEGKDATYPVNVDFIISYEGSYSYEYVQSNFVFPMALTGSFSYSEYEKYLTEDRARFGDAEFKDASVTIDGMNFFIEQGYYKLNPDDGFYHVYDEVKYAEYGGWGPILYANVTIPTKFIDSAFNTIESNGNKALTLSSGTENYKLFIEGYNALVGESTSYFCIQGCKCIEEGNGGCCSIEKNCKKCTKDCRHIPAKYIGQQGYADIAIEGRCAVTEELKDFLQKYCVKEKLFSDGFGFAEQTNPRYDAYEDSMWLFACGYYTN